MSRYCETEHGAYIQPWNGVFMVEVVRVNDGDASSETFKFETLEEAFKKLEDYFNGQG